MERAVVLNFGHQVAAQEAKSLAVRALGTGTPYRDARMGEAQKCKGR